MSHQVAIDEERINAAFDHFAQKTEAAEGEYIPRGEEREPGDTEHGGWQPEADWLTEIIFVHAFPNWEVPPKEQSKFADSLRDQLDRWFPGGGSMVDRWSPWQQLLFRSAKIFSMYGVDVNTFTLKPGRAPGEREHATPPAGGGFAMGDDDDGEE